MTLKNNKVADLRRALKCYNTKMLERMSSIKSDRETMIRKIVADKTSK